MQILSEYCLLKIVNKLEIQELCVLDLRKKIGIMNRVSSAFENVIHEYCSITADISLKIKVGGSATVVLRICETL